MAQLNLVTPADKAGGLRHGGDKAAIASRAGGLPQSAQRIARSTEPPKESPRQADQQAARGVTRFNVAASAPPAAHPPAPASGIRFLVAGLIVVALAPNLTLAAIVWLGLIDAPWSKQATPPPPAVQTASPPAVLTAPAALEAAAGETISFPIALDGTDGVPARSIIAITGLPPGSTFSDGRPYGETEWNLKSDQIGDLHLALPSTANGVSRLAIKLITPDDKVVADTETELKVVASAPSAQAAEPADAGAAIVPATATASDPSQDDGAATEEERTAPQTAVAPTDDAQTAPSEKSDPAAAEGPTAWVQPSAYVNLRDAPSSSSRVIGVIAKGAKIPVLERKRGWLQVTNPATSDKGWIYSGYVDGAPKSRPRTKRAATPEPEQKSESSFWGWLVQ